MRLCDSYLRLSNTEEFTKQKIIVFAGAMIRELKARGIRAPTYPSKILNEMILPDSNEINMALGEYACELLFVGAMTELAIRHADVSDDEKDFTRNSIARIKERFYATQTSNQTRWSNRDLQFFRRDILPLVGPFVKLHLLH